MNNPEGCLDLYLVLLYSTEGNAAPVVVNIELARQPQAPWKLRPYERAIGVSRTGKRLQFFQSRAQVLRPPSRHGAISWASPT